MFCSVTAELTDNSLYGDFMSTNDNRANDILVTGCGAFTGLEVVRALRMADSKERILGTEVSWFGKRNAEQECDEVTLIPRAYDPGYEDAMIELLDQSNVGLVFVNYDIELEHIASWRNQVSTSLSCPDQASLEACLDKGITFDRADGHVAIPGTLTVESETDIEHGFERYGRPLWLRCATGQSGRGSIIVSEPHHASSWIRYWQDVKGSTDEWLAHEYLPGRNLNWTSLWYEGELITSVAGERLKYFLAGSSVSGITGNVSHCRTIKGGIGNETAEAAVRAVVGNPHGLFSVDLCEDKEGIPRLTEINARCAFRPLLLAKAGVNFPRILADIVLYDRLPALPRYDAATIGVEMHRGMDVEPVFLLNGDDF